MGGSARRPSSGPGDRDCPPRETRGCRPGAADRAVGRGGAERGVIDLCDRTDLPRGGPPSTASLRARSMTRVKASRVHRAASAETPRVSLSPRKGVSRWRSAAWRSLIIARTPYRSGLTLPGKVKSQANPTLTRPVALRAGQIVSNTDGLHAPAASGREASAKHSTAEWLLERREKSGAHFHDVGEGHRGLGGGGGSPQPPPLGFACSLFPLRRRPRAQGRSHEGTRPASSAQRCLPRCAPPTVPSPRWARRSAGCQRWRRAEGRTSST